MSPFGRPFVLDKPECQDQSLLLAHEVPPQDIYGDIGNTEFADSRTAYADLPTELKEKIQGRIVNHTQLHSRRKGAPDSPLVWEDRVGPVSHVL